MWLDKQAYNWWCWKEQEGGLLIACFEYLYLIYLCYVIFVGNFIANLDLRKKLKLIRIPSFWKKKIEMLQFYHEWIMNKRWIHKGLAKSKSKSSAKSWSFNIFMDVLLVNWVFDYFSSTKGNISAWVEISWSCSKSTFSSSPCFNFRNLHQR
jgi:hypothetical protein